MHRTSKHFKVYLTLFKNDVTAWFFRSSLLCTQGFVTFLIIGLYMYTSFEKLLKLSYLNVQSFHVNTYH